MFHKQSWVHFGLILMLLLSGFEFAPPPSGRTIRVNARTIRVTTTADDLTTNGNCTLREAIQAANTDHRVDGCPAGSGDDIIRLGSGTYTISLAGDLEDQNQTGDFDITQSVRILGVSKDETILDAAQIDRIFDIRNTVGTVEIRRMTLQNGETGRPDKNDPGGALSNHGKARVDQVWFLHNSTDEFIHEYGGALVNFGAITISNSHFEGNTSGEYGSALANKGDMTILGSELRLNIAEKGAIYASSGGDPAAGGDLPGVVTIRNTLFISNQCGEGTSSTIFQETGSSMSIKNSQFQDNGGCTGELISNYGDLIIRYTNFITNNGGEGGLIQNYAGRLQLTHSSFNNNVADTDNAVGTVNILDGRATLDRVTIAHGSGPALLVRGGEVRLANSTFNFLTGAECSPAVCMMNGKLSIESVTMAHNRGSFIGGNLAVMDGEVTVHNSILADTFEGNYSTPMVDCSMPPNSVTSLGYNLISRTGGYCTWPTAPTDQVGSMDAPVDPMLDTLKDNGGPTPTMALLPGSPAIDAADPLHFFKTDQRMYPRPAGSRADIGAFEYGALPPDAQNAESEDAESE